MSLQRDLKRLKERKRLGEILLEMGLLTEDQLKVALEKSSKTKVLLGKLLVSEGYVNEEEMAKALANQFGLQSADLSQWIGTDPTALKMIPESVVRQHQVLPLRVENNTLLVAVHDPLNLVNLNSVPELAGKMVMPLVAPEGQLKGLIDKLYKGESDTKMIQMIASNLQQRAENVVPLHPPRNAQPSSDTISEEKRFSVENLLNKIMQKAIDERASDVHFEPLREHIRVRQRIDGILHEAQILPMDIYPSLISRIKILGKMDIAERRQPQDGHFQIRMGSRDVDFRASTLPTMHGEKTVLRILDKSAQRASMSETGMSSELQEEVRRLVHKPFGIILVTGPTGSGKTTTVYSMIKEIDRLSHNVVTIEDPVEFEIEDVNQVQVNPKANILFANTLRSVLRQDPDVIVVGEIRDKETAEIAIRSALTGHLVISTIHTNNSFGTLSRLVEMGIEPYLVSSSVAAILSQRLVRKLCPECKVPHKITEAEREIVGKDLVPENAIIFTHRGCEKCNNIGFRGRVGLFELLVPDAALRKLVSQGQQIDEATINHAKITGFHSMRKDGLQKLIDGVTSIAEVLSETI